MTFLGEEIVKESGERDTGGQGKKGRGGDEEDQVKLDVGKYIRKGGGGGSN